MSDKAREEAAAIGFHAAMDKPFSEAADWLEEVTAGLAAADAHDTANGVHRVSLDEATVGRAVKALDDNFYISRNEGEYDASAVWGTTEQIARAVLTAAVKEEQ